MTELPQHLTHILPDGMVSLKPSGTLDCYAWSLRMPHQISPRDQLQTAMGWMIDELRIQEASIPALMLADAISEFSGEVIGLDISWERKTRKGWAAKSYTRDIKALVKVWSECLAVLERLCTMGIWPFEDHWSPAFALMGLVQDGVLLLPMITDLEVMEEPTTNARKLLANQAQLNKRLTALPDEGRSFENPLASQPSALFLDAAAEACARAGSFEEIWLRFVKARAAYTGLMATGGKKKGQRQKLITVKPDGKPMNSIAKRKARKKVVP